MFVPKNILKINGGSDVVMKIQNINNYMGYKSTKPVKKDEMHETNKYDKIEINNKNVKDRVSISSVKKKILSEINEETSAEKINKIKDSINNKTYSIDVEEIVRKLLK
jgi:anti-sigma28 factor (negative regulator of flagellin synthesis)